MWFFGIVIAWTIKDVLPLPGTLSWWRALHGIMCLAQLPHADGFDLEVDREMSVNPGAPSMVNLHHRARSHRASGGG